MPVISNPHLTIASTSASGTALVDILAEENDCFVIDDEHLLVNSNNPFAVRTLLIAEAKGVAISGVV